MTSKAEIKPKIFKVYNLDEFEELLNGVQVATCMLIEPHQTVDETSVIKHLSALTLNGAAEGNCCSCCGIGPFESRAQQTAHYKHHWHTHNLKRKLFGKPSLTFGQFNSRQDDNSSVSGSDSDTEGVTINPSGELFAAATRHCKAFFTNTKGKVFCVYRCILHHRKEDLSTDGEGKKWIERCQQIAKPGFQRWAIFMISGGHFAGGIFSGVAPVVHKTLHSYVTRRGQGQAQATRDQHGNAPRSAGASLRRYNQAQFLEHVQEVLNSWAEDLKGCTLIMYRAVGPTNQAALFGKNSPINRDQMRVRALPFPTRKPTYKEVRRVHDTLTSVEVYESMELFQKAFILKPAAKSSSDTSVAERSKKTQKASPNKLDRAKSRERTPRELPTQIISSEDEGPCYIDSETPKNWTKTLSEQTSIGIISNSRKDLLVDYAVPCPISSESECDAPEAKSSQQSVTKKKKKSKSVEDDKIDKQVVKKVAVKVSANIKKMWKLIESIEGNTLEPIFEGWESEYLQTACNTQDPADGNTALHKAAKAQKSDMVTQLLSAGSDPCIRNYQQQTPYASTPDAGTRVAFRLFQAENPDKFNYAKSQIPGPLTPELLEQEKEKKAQQKRAKRQREKEKQVEKAKTNQFLQLNDAQKAKIADKRCFLCGSQLPKAAFEYDSYSFCTVKCLQNHRNLRPLHMST